MRRFFEPAAMPAWLKPVLSSIRAALGDVWDVPLRPFQAETAMLPPAAVHKGGIVYDSTLDRLGYSSGADWRILADAKSGDGLALIEEYAGDGTTGTHIFSSIPDDYRRLILEWVARSSDAAVLVNMTAQFNGDTGANYHRQHVGGIGAAAAAGEALATTSAIIGTFTGAGATAGYPGVGQLVIPEYAATTFSKQGLTEHCWQSGTASGNMGRRSSVIGWSSTAAINSLTVSLSAGNFVTGSKLRLYGQN